MEEVNLGCGSTKQSADSAVVSPSGGKETDSPAIMDAPKISFPAMDSPQRANSSGSVRAKVALKPGRSLMDWIRLGASGKDLTGVGGAHRTVSFDELSKHNKKENCWIAIRGKVYNITPYLEYHPGGIPEIMKGAGKDGTSLFDEIHKWVNAESMLEKCFVGPLEVGRMMGPPRRGSNRLLNKSTGSLKSANTLSVASPASGLSLPQPSNESTSPRYDWYQNDKIVTISIYTKFQDLQIEDIIMELKEEKDFDVILILGENSYEVHLDLDDKITDQKVRISSNVGKVDILLTKASSGEEWKTLGKPLDGDNSLKPHKTRGSRFWECTLISSREVTHNAKLYCCELPSGVQMRVPIGHHVHMKRNIQGMELTRSYTVVLPSLKVDPDEREYAGKRFYLMIKHYPSGALTPSLEPLIAGDTILISDYSGTFKESRLLLAKDVCLVAAGTGFTPMVRLIRRLLVDEIKNIVNVKLLFANQEEKDILWRGLLDELAELCSQSFQVHYTVSKPSPEWEGYEGRISTEMLLETLPPPPSEDNSSDLLICVCGPDPFTHGILSKLKELNYSSHMIHAFLG